MYKISTAWKVIPLSIFFLSRLKDKVCSVWVANRNLLQGAGVPRLGEQQPSQQHHYWLPQPFLCPAEPRLLMLIHSWLLGYVKSLDESMGIILSQSVSHSLNELVSHWLPCNDECEHSANDWVDIIIGWVWVLCWAIQTVSHWDSMLLVTSLNESWVL